MYTYKGKRYHTLHYATLALWADLREDRIEADLMGRTWRPPVLCICGPGREVWVWQHGTLHRAESAIDAQALAMQEDGGTWTPITRIAAPVH